MTLKRNRRVFAILLTCIIAFALFTSACSSGTDEDSKTDSPSDFLKPTNAELADLTNGLPLPDEANKTKWTVTQNGSISKLTAAYEKISLRTVMGILRILSESQWLVSGNSAFKGARSLEMAYSTDTQVFSFTLTRDSASAEWPGGLPPDVAHFTPVFDYGHFVSTETRTLENTESATMLLYKDVTKQDMTDYEKLLIASGYSFDTEKNGQRFFVNRPYYFATLTYNAEKGQAALILGKFKIYAAALPPWPDPLPEALKRALPPISGRCSVVALDDGYEATALEISLSQLSAFFKGAAGYYEWTELGEDNILTNKSLGYQMLVTFYDTAESRFQFILSSTGELKPTVSPTTSPSPTLPPKPTATNDGAFDDGLADYEYRLTEESYSETEVMDGILWEFGQVAELADWNEIKNSYAREIGAFLDYAGVKGNEDVWLKRGSNAFDGNRHYFLARIDGVPRQGFNKYDAIGNTAWLGSWYGIKLRVLVKILVE